MKKLFLFLSLLLLLTCAKEDSQAPNTPPTNTTNPTTTPTVTQYTLTVTAGEGGSVSTAGGTYNDGTSISITATPSQGYNFSSWSNGSTANPLNVTLNSNTSVTANFELLLNGFYQFDPIPVYNEEGYYSPTSLAADLDGDGNDELILTIQNPDNHYNSSLIQKIPIKILSFNNEELVDVTSSFFSEIPSTYFTRQIIFEDLNHDGLKDLYFVNHGAEVNDVSVFYHQESGQRIDGIWSEKDLIYFNNNGIFQKADYFDVSDYSHGASIINITSDGKNSILRNEVSPPPKNLGGKNSIITFENGEFKINNIVSGIEDNLWKEYFCPGSFWMYPIDIDSDGVDEIVSQSKIFKLLEDGYIESELNEGIYASENYFLNEGGFVFDIDNDGDEDLIKSASKTTLNCQLSGFRDHQLEFYENINGTLNPNTGKLPPHPSNLSKYFKPFDVNFDGYMDIVFYAATIENDPTYFLMNTGNSFELKEFDLDQFDGIVLLNGEQTNMQQFPNFRYSWFLESNDGYIFVTGIDNGLIAFRITNENVNVFIK